MKRFKPYRILNIVLSICLLFTYGTISADDTCVFMVTADDVPPNIIILLDNGAEMEKIVPHSSYDSNIDHTPAAAPQLDVVEIGLATGNGFFNGNGYSIYVLGNKYYLADIPASLLVDDHAFSLMADGGGGDPIWTINTRTVTLPADPSTVVDADGVKDNATNFRYDKNYLNWIFFGNPAGGVPDSGGYVGDGSDLPAKSRFYFAKKALMTVAKLTSNQARFGVRNFTSTAAGAFNVQPLGMVVSTPLAALPENNTLDSNYVNNLNNMGTVTYSPLAEGLADVAGTYANNSSSQEVVDVYCQKNFALVMSPGVSSEDQAMAAQSSPGSLSDYDVDGEGDLNIIDADGTTTITIPVNQGGSTYLDDIAHYLYSNDIVGYRDGFQNIMTYTIGFMGDDAANRFLINTSNNGNGNFNLYDTRHEEYGKYHYEAQDPDELATAVLAAVNAILSATSSFTAPVVPVTRTTSGNRIYMAFFKPGEGNFWEGNVTKFGISDINTIVGSDNQPATWDNGAMREDAAAYWQTKDWADDTKANYISDTLDTDPATNPNLRNIYTYFGSNTALTHSSNKFWIDNLNLTTAVLGNPTHTTAEIINYIRGADVFDEDEDGSDADTRAVITGDVLHSEPLVFQFNFPDDSSKTLVFFGANDGMLHAVLDVTDPDVDTADDETNHGTEAWAYIPPDQLHRLKNILESGDHQYYVDSSPKIYFKDVDRDGIIDVADNDQVVLICGERKGGTSYFALDVTDPLAPKYLWRIDRSNGEAGILQLSNINSGFAFGNGGTFEDGDDLRIWDGAISWGPAIAASADGNFNLVDNILRYDSATLPFAAGQWVGTLTTAIYAVRNTTPIPFIWGQIVSIATADPDVIIPELGESWSEPQFGRVKTSDDPNDIGTPVFFIGGGYSSDNSSGKAVLAINVLTGAVVEKFKNGPNLDGYGNISGMDYSIASSVTLIDADNNGFVDKVYVGDLGGQLWRLGRFTDASNAALGFPDVDENIHNWTGQILFSAPPYDDVAAVTHNRKFFYPPSVTLEHDYDLLFAGTGDRDNACDDTTSDIFFAVKDNHGAVTFDEADLVDVTDPADARPDLDSDASNVDGGNIDQGWYIQLAAGEKVIAENTVFYKTAYITTFTPNDDACLPGGVGNLYALNYKTSAAAIDFDNDGIEDPSIAIGGGIPSKVVMVITDFGGVNNTSSGGAKLFISVGSTNPDANSEAFDAGVVIFDPITPKINFYYLWWRELLTQ